MADKNKHIEDEKFDLQISFKGLDRVQSETIVDMMRQMSKFIDEESTEWLCILVDGDGGFKPEIKINEKPALEWSSPQRGYYSPVRFRNSNNRWVREEVYKCIT